MKVTYSEPSAVYSEPIAFAVECHRKGEFAEARRIYEDLLAENPGYPDALHLMGLLLHDTGQPELAIGYIARAIALAPEVPYYHSNLGNAFQQLGRYEDATLCYQEALRLQPDLAEAYNNLGNALAALHNTPEAIASLLEAVKWKPDYHQAFANLARVMYDHARWQDAASCYDHARSLEPSCRAYVDGLVGALAKQGESLAKAGDHQTAIAHYNAALSFDGGSPDLHMLLAHSLLITGQFEPGWNHFEWRWQLEGCPPAGFSQPLWDGSPLAGRRILLWAEQGMGDTIQFARFAAQVKDAGATVILECQPALARLMQTCPGIDEVVPFGSILPAFDLHAPLQSLPRILGTTLESIPAPCPYLLAGADPVREWQARLAPHSRLRVGFTHAGSPRNHNDRVRSIPAETFDRLKQTPGVEWFSLRREDLPGDFADAAALLANLDLVISVDTAAAHLAGALGKPVWTLLPFACDYRWLLDREDTPWYPSMRLFRQPSEGDWDSVIAGVSRALESLCRP